MAARNYWSAEDLTEALYTNTAYGSAHLSLTIPSPPANSDLIAFWFAQQQKDSGLNYCKLDDGTTDFGENITDYGVSDEWNPVCGFTRIQTGGSPPSLTLNIKQRGSTTTDARIDDAHIVVLKAEGADEFNSVASFSTSSNTFADALSLTFTPATEGDYLILSTASFGTDNVAVISEMQLDIDSVASRIQRLDMRITDERRPYQAMEKVTLDATSHTIKIQQRRTTAGGTAVNSQDLSIYAIRLDTLDSEEYAEAVRSTTTSSTLQTNATLTATFSAVDYLVLTNMLLDADAGDAGSRFDQASSELFRENHFNPITNGNTDKMNSLFPRIRTLTASSITFETKFKSFGTDVSGLESAIAVLQIESAAVGPALPIFDHHNRMMAA